MGWDFKSKEVAQTLADMARENGVGRNVNDQRDFATRNVNPTILIKTPEGGIAAAAAQSTAEGDRDELKMGTAECVLLSTYDPSGSSDERNQSSLNTVRRPDASTTTPDWRDSENKIWVANPFPDKAPGDSMMTAIYIDGSYVLTVVPVKDRVQFYLSTSIIAGT